jgi:hypothetical protein
MAQLLDDIAATLTAVAQPTETVAPPEVQDEKTQLELDLAYEPPHSPPANEAEVDPDATSGDAPPDDESQMEASEYEPKIESEDASGEETDAEITTADEETYLDVSDDDLIEVAIDGKVEYRTLRDMKEAMSGEGAIQKRLKEATEMRKSAETVLTAETAKLDNSRQLLAGAFQQFQQQLFPPHVEEPSLALRASDPTAYLVARDDFEQDQARIKQGNEALAGHFTKMQQDATDQRNIWSKNQAQMLTQKRPEFGDPKTQKAVAQKVLDVAGDYGVSAEELAGIGDHRLFMMALDLSEFRALKEAKNNPTVVTSPAAKTGIKRLRSGVALRKTAARSNAKQQAALANKARSTGKTDDVAATLYQSR